MRVAINAVPLMSTLTGIGYYVRNLSESLLRIGQTETLFFNGTNWSQEIHQQMLPAAASRLKRALRNNLPYSYELSRFIQQIAFSQGVKNCKPDLYHETSFLSYRFDDPIVLTVHDLSWIRFPETHPVERVRAMHKFFEPSLARADHIITDANFVKQELIDVFGLDPSKIHPIHLAAEALFKPMRANETETVLQTKGLKHRQYWLVAGTLEPRKNLELVLEAFSALPAPLRKKTPLVLAGMVGWNVGKLLQKIEAMEHTGGLVRLGYVSRQDLATVMAGAKALILPSIYEGFGLPLVEAMQCGTPVLSSNASCLPEVLDGAGLLFSPNDSDRLKALMLQILEDDGLTDTLSAKGLERSQHFDWEKTAQQTLAVYSLAVG
jgi:glycosyltransferase involved in cell wall biosynthesis